MGFPAGAPYIRSTRRHQSMRLLSGLNDFPLSSRAHDRVPKEGFRIGKGVTSFQ